MWKWKKYKSLKWNIIRIAQKAKKEWIEEMCEDIKLGKTDQASRLIKRNFHEYQLKSRNITNENKSVLLEI